MEEILKRGLIIILVMAIVLLTYYILKGILLTKLGKLKGDKKVWFAWVPILSTYYLGKLTFSKIVGAILVALNILTSSGSFTTGSTTINISFLSLLPESVSIIITIFNLLLNIALLIYAVVLIKKLKKTKPIDEQKINETAEVIEELDLDSNTDNIEVLNFDDNTNIENTLEQKKENRFTIIILAVIIVFALLLPTISNIFNPKDNNKIDNTVKSDITYNEITGKYLEIGSNKGNIIAKNIQFYDFKKANNKITYTYLPQDEIKNVNDLGIYIEYYDENEKLLLRNKFTSNTTLSRKVISTNTLFVGTEIYEKAKYATIAIISDTDFQTINSTLTCTNTEDADFYRVSTKVKYYFSKYGLSYYEEEQKREILGEETDDAKQLLKETINKMSGFIKDDVENLEVTDTTIKYKVNLLKDNRNITESYQLGTSIEEVKQNEILNNWSCTNE